MSKAQSKVLIVEDDLVQSFLLETVFSSLGFSIVGKVTTGAGAIELAQLHRPDIISMDIMLDDDIDGIDAAKEIQKFLKTKLIYVSGNKDQYTLKRASETDYCCFFQKPLLLDELKKVLNELVED